MPVVQRLTWTCRSAPVPPSDPRPGHLPRHSRCHHQSSASATNNTLTHWTLGNVPISFNTLRPRQNGRRFADDTFKRIFLKENVRISIKISLKFVHKSPIDNIPALFQILAWRRPGGKPLSEAMMVSLLTHICVARPQWVKVQSPNTCDGLS